MLPPQSHLLSTVDRILGVRARGDIQQVAVPVAGQRSFVLKDPLTLEHFQLTPAEYFLLEELRQPTTLAELKRGFEARFAPRTISFVALQHGINQLFEQGLLVGSSADSGKRLLDRAAKKRRIERCQSMLKALSFRVISWNATTIVDSIHAMLRWVFSPLAAFAAILLTAYSLWLLLAHGSNLYEKMPYIGELWQPRFLFLWLVTIVMVKILHELGHAITCRHFGGRCHEMGVMLLAFFPALYCDVSDVWQMPNKWQRMAVSSAGLVVELVLAAMAFIGWWHTEPGLLNTWLLGIAIICSVGTLAINANPLLRYDGYYLLADWLEIPNMASRGQGLLFKKLRQWLLAESDAIDPLLTRTQQLNLAIYAVASRLYSFVVIIAIYAMLLALARPLHLENLIYTIAVFTVGGLVMPPLISAWQLLRNPAHRARIKRPRAAIVCMILVAMVVIVLFCPMNRTVEGNAVLIPTDGHTIYATMAGELLRSVAPGTPVHAGDIIAELHDPTLKLAVVKQAGELAVKRAHFQQLKTLRALDARFSRQLPTAQADLADAQAQLTQYQLRAEELVLRTPINGIVIAPPAHDPEPQSHRLATWTGSPLEKRNQHALIESGTVICTVGDSTRLSALVTIDERDVAEVQPGDPVRILLDSPPLLILDGKVKQVASRAVEPASDESTATKTRRHVVEVELTAHEVQPLIGARGTAKIEGSRSTLASLATGFVKRRLRLPW